MDFGSREETALLARREEPDSGRARAVGFRITTRSGIWAEIKIRILGPTRRAGFRVHGKRWISGAGQEDGLRRSRFRGHAGFRVCETDTSEATMRRAPQEQKTKGEAQPKSSWPAPAATTRATRTPNPESKRQHPRQGFSNLGVRGSSRRGGYFFHEKCRFRVLEKSRISGRSEKRRISG